MARWTMVRDALKVGLIYQNLQSGQEEHLGCTSSNTDDQTVYEWILTVGKPQDGDVIVFSNGSSKRYETAPACLN